MINTHLCLLSTVISSQIGSLCFQNVEISKLSRASVRSCFLKMFGSSSIFITTESAEENKTKYFVNIYSDSHIIIKVNARETKFNTEQNEDIATNTTLNINAMIEYEPEEIYIFPKSKNFDADESTTISNNNFLAIIDSIMLKMNRYTVNDTALIYFTFSGSQQEAFFNKSNLDSKIEISKKEFEMNDPNKFKAKYFPNSLNEYCSEKLYLKEKNQDVICLHLENHKILSFISKSFHENLYYDCAERMKNYDFDLNLELGLKYIYQYCLILPVLICFLWLFC